MSMIIDSWWCKQTYLTSIYRCPGGKVWLQNSLSQPMAQLQFDFVLVSLKSDLPEEVEYALWQSFV